MNTLITTGTSLDLAPTMVAEIDDSFEYSPLAQACRIAGGVAACVRDSLANDKGLDIIEAWGELEDNDEKTALASLRATLSRESKKVYGFGLTVKDGELVEVLGRSKQAKVKPVKSAFMVACTAFELNASPEDIKIVMNLIASCNRQGITQA